MDIFAREFGSEKDANGNTIMEDIDGVQCPKTKKVLAKETRRMCMGICKCRYAGPVGLECNTCKQAFVILRTTCRETIKVSLVA